MADVDARYYRPKVKPPRQLPPPRKKPGRKPTYDPALVTRLWKRGVLGKLIAIEIGVHPQSLPRIIKALGLPLRHPHLGKWPKYYVRLPPDLNELLTRRAAKSRMRVSTYITRLIKKELQNELE